MYLFNVQSLSVQSRDHRRCCVFCCVYLISTHLVQSVRLSLTHRYRRYHQLIMLCSCSIQSDYSFLFIHWFLQLLFLFFYTNVYGKTKWIEHFALYSIHKLWCPFTTVASVTLMISTKRCLDHDIEPNCIWNVYTCKGKIYHFINIRFHEKRSTSNWQNNTIPISSGLEVMAQHQLVSSPQSQTFGQFYHISHYSCWKWSSHWVSNHCKYQRYQFWPLLRKSLLNKPEFHKQFHELDAITTNHSEISSASTKLIDYSTTV